MTRTISTTFVPLALAVALGAASTPASARAIGVPGAALEESLGTELVQKVRSKDHRHTRRSPHDRHRYVWRGHYYPYYYYSSYIDHGCFWHAKKHGHVWRRVRICY